MNAVEHQQHNGKLLHGFLLGNRIVEPHLGAVIADGELHQVPAQTMALLVLFAEHAGEVVSREQIAATLWNGSGVSYGTLTRHVSEIRRSLGDDARQPQYLETVPRQGYKLIGKVVPEEECSLIEESLDGALKSNVCRGLTDFWVELCKRRVVRAALLYVLAVWVSLQVGELVIPLLALPEWTLTLVFLLGVLGFPIAIVLAWVFQVTSGGLSLDIALGTTPRTRGGRGAAILVIGTLLLVILVLSGQLVMQAQANESLSGSGTETSAAPATAAIDGGAAAQANMYE